MLRHGRLHRYNTAADEISETAALEEEFAKYTGAKYCLAVASGGYALGCAMRAIGIVPGDKVRVELSPYDLTKGRIVYRER